MPKMNFSISKSETRILIFFFLSVFSYQYFLNAWITEDAFINFRVIKNFLDGYGLVWNKGERVQVFTSPLWILLNVVTSYLTGELFYSTIFLSFVITILVFVVLFYSAGKNVVIFIFTATTILLSKSFLDYSSSGLETPLLSLSLAVFSYLWCVNENYKHKTFVLAVSASICIIVRHDTILLTLPFIVNSILVEQKKKSVKIILEQVIELITGFLIFIAWSVFSLIYYGSVLPNTAYAKMIGNTDQFNTVNQAIKFLQFVQVFDPATFFIIAFSVVISFLSKSRHFPPLISALVLFFLYLLHIGGDYMASRFFIAPVTLSIILITDVILKESTFLAFERRQSIAIVAVSIIVIGVMCLRPVNSSLYVKPVIIDGIADERSIYYGATDFLTLAFSDVQHSFRSTGEKVKRLVGNDDKLVISCHVGMVGYYSGSDTHIIDPLAITDSFLARFAIRPGEQRIGHFERLVPRQYVLSVLTKSNQFSEPLVYQYYEDILQATQKELFSNKRFMALWRLNTGFYATKLNNSLMKNIGGPLLTTGIPKFEMHSCLGGEKVPVYMVGLDDINKSNSISPL